MAPEKWAALERIFFEALKMGLPPQIVHTFLVRRPDDPNIWRIITIWRSREAREEMSKLTRVPAGVRIFRAAGAEPVLTEFEVRETSLK